MNLSLTLASSCSLLSALLVVAPAFADEPSAPVTAPPAYSLPPGQGYGPSMYGPSAPKPLLLEAHRASPALIVTGSLTTFAGVGAMVGGALAYTFATGIICEAPNCGSSGGGGIALMIGGSLAIAGGVTMIVVGARKVSTPPTQASFLLRATGVDLRVTF